MAPPAGTLRVGRYFLTLLGIAIVLYVLVFFPGERHTPKLGLDLEGGTQLVLKASTPDGKAPSKSSLNEARDIINERVNGKGVAEADVVTQGNDEIVVSIPGKNADLSDIGTTAQLNFRPLCALPFSSALGTAGEATPAASGTPTTSGSAATPTTSAAGASDAGSSPAAQGDSETLLSPQDDGATPLALDTTPVGPQDATTPADTTIPTDTGVPADTGAATPSPSASGAADDTDAGCSGTVAPVTQTSASASDSSTPTASTTPSASPTGSATPSPTDSATPTPTPSPSSSVDPTTLYTGVTAEQAAALYQLDCTKDTTALDSKANANDVIVACSQDGTAKYLLGRVIVPGTQIKSAAAAAPDGQTLLTWAVNIDLKSSGQKAWADWTAAHNSSTSDGSDTDPNNYVAFVLDGQVLSAPHTNGAISGTTQVSGTFNQKSATDLANSLKYGALPLSFSTERSGSVSATLGTAQLKAGLLAGGIGLILVVIYSLIYYRALGVVTVLSLVVSGVLTYASLVILGRAMGFTLSLAGIAGFIVAVGITADSFVVLFERIKDEVHEGRTMRVAVPRAWERARRTILSADTVSLLAAVILYYFASDQVKGFAFTLGLSTVLDLVVVFLFTHPIVSLLSRSPAFGSARFSGLNAARVGGVAVREERPARARTAPPARRGSSRGGTAVLERTDIDADPDIDAEIDIDDELDEPLDEDLQDQLDAAGDDVADEASADDVDDVDAPGGAEDDAVEAESAADEAPTPTRRRPARSAPIEPAEGETAADRAAARRARLRAQRGNDQKGDS